LQWIKTIGGINQEWGYSIVQTSDGGFAIAGYTSSFGAGNDDIYVIKLDANGNLQWTKTIGGTNLEWGYSIVQTSDGGFAIVGYTESFGAGLQDVYVVKLDANGNLQWTKTIGGANVDFGNSIVQTSDGGFVIAGHTNSFSGGGGIYDVYIIKLDTNGNLMPCPGGCQVSSGGTVSSGGIVGSGGQVGTGGTVSSGGSTNSGGTLVNICP